MDILAVLREIRETTEFFIKLPELLVSSILDVNLAYRTRKERIEVLKEIVELRELAKILQSAAVTKGDLLAYAQDVTATKNVQEADNIKDAFFHIAELLEEFQNAMKETAFSNTALATDASMFVSRAIRAYKLFFTIKNEDLLKDKTLVEVTRSVLQLSNSATDLIKRLDEHRRVLDHTYGE